MATKADKRFLYVGGDDHDMEGESPSGVNEWIDETKAITEVCRIHTLAPECPSLTIIEEMVQMFLRLGFSQTVVQKLVGD